MPVLGHAGGHPAVRRVFAQAHELGCGRVPRADPVSGQKAERIFAAETQAEQVLAARAVEGQSQHARCGFLEFLQERAGEQREQRVAEAAEKRGTDPAATAADLFSPCH